MTQRYNRHANVKPESLSLHELMQKPVFYLRIYDVNSGETHCAYIRSDTLTRLMIKVLNKSTTLHDRKAVVGINEIVRSLRYIMTFSKQPSVSLGRIRFMCVTLNLPLDDYIIYELPKE